MPSVAIIGAGIAGLAAAAALGDAGVRVRLFDKGRGPGGRMATRRTDTGLAFDHGAQFLTARDPAFAATLRAWLQDGKAAIWAPLRARGSGRQLRPYSVEEPWFVGQPGMNAIIRAAAARFEVNWGTPVAALRQDGGWHLRIREGREAGPFSHLVLAVPAPQAAALLGGLSPLAARLGEAAYDPCWAAMLAFEHPLPFEADYIEGPPTALIGALIRMGSKPGRLAAGGPERWVAHLSPAASARHLEDAPADLLARIQGELEAMTGAPLPAPVHAAAHRWRYAKVSRALGEACLADAAGTLALCGDYCLGPRIELAWLSGRAAGRYIAQSLGAGTSAR